MGSVLVHAAVAPLMLGICLGFVCLRVLGDAQMKSECERSRIHSKLAAPSIVSVLFLMLGAALIFKN